MTKSVHDRHSKTTKKKSKPEEEANLRYTEALEAELEPKYAITRFYSLRRMHFAYGVFVVVVNMFLYYFLPGARYFACGNNIFWIASFLLSKHASRYEGTEHEEYGKKLFIRTFRGIFLLHEIYQVCDDSLASEEGRSAHASMIILTEYFLHNLILQIATNPRFKVVPWAQFVVFPAIVWQKPRFGIFQPHYEALAFSLAMFFGYLIGSVIDEMSWRHHVQMHKKELEIQRKTKELSKESRKRAMAMEVLESYNDKSSFFEIRKPAT